MEALVAKMLPVVKNELYERGNAATCLPEDRHVAWALLKGLLEISEVLNVPKALMSQQVRQAFPELPVVLNPLQQARQQVTARQTGAAADPGQRFPSLLQLVGSHLPFMVGSVDTLTFEQGRLHLELLADSRSPAAEGEWQAALAQAGFTATRDDHGWSIAPAQIAEKPGAGDE